jgi:hypothetical protein
MTKEQIKEDIIKTILSLNSDISNYDRSKLIKLLESIVDYTNNTELEQKVTQLQQKYNELVETVEDFKSRIQALEHSSQS